MKKASDIFEDLPDGSEFTGGAGWQPIETAPAGHGDVLLWSEGWERVTIGSRDRMPHIGAWIDADARRWVANPTHWMPLPEPPKAGSVTVQMPMIDELDMEGCE